MLNAFMLDEHVLYPIVIQMTTNTGSLSGTIRNFLFYDCYPYGYPFFFASAVTVLPVKVMLKLFHDINETTAYMVVLRQLSPLFMIMAMLVLVYLWTGFKSLSSSLFLFVFVASIPGVVDNNMLWHPDSLATLFVILTIFALSKDALKFGKWFYLSAIFCGLATGTKWLGQFFFLTIAVYLGLGLFQQKIGFKRLVAYGSAFVLLMALALVASNPLLVLPEELTKMVSLLKSQARWNKWLGTPPVPLWERPEAWYIGALNASFGFWWVYALALGLCVLGVFCDRQKRLLNLIILTWILPTSVYIMLTMMPTPRYFIPISLPLMSCLGSPMTWDDNNRRSLHKTATILSVITVLLCGIQLAYYTKSNIASYKETVTRETSSPPILFYQELDRAYLSKLPKNMNIDALCDPYVYIAPSKNLVPRYTKHWSTEYGDCQPTQPDLIVLRRYYIDMYSDPEILGKEPDQEQARRSHRFYADARNNAMKGFHKVFEADYGVAFARDK